MFFKMNLKLRIVTKTEAEGVLRVVPETDEVQLWRVEKFAKPAIRGFCRHSWNPSSYIFRCIRAFFSLFSTEVADDH